MKQQPQNEWKKWKEHERRGGVEQEEWTESEKGGPKFVTRITSKPLSYRRSMQEQKIWNDSSNTSIVRSWRFPSAQTARLVTTIRIASLTARRTGKPPRHNEETIDKSRFGAVSYRRKHRSALHRVHYERNRRIGGSRTEGKYCPETRTPKEINLNSVSYGFTCR